jgi:hypothetical protein
MYGSTVAILVVAPTQPLVRLLAAARPGVLERIATCESAAALTLTIARV